MVRLDYAVSQEHTLSFFLGAKHKKDNLLQSRAEVLDAILARLHAPTTIQCLQQLAFNHYLITFFSHCASTRDCLSTVGFYLNGSYVGPVEVEPLINSVDVRNLPIQVADDVVREALTIYGETVSVSTLSDDHGICTGNRLVKMHISSSIPSSIRVGSYVAHIRYRGQRKCCRY